MEVGPCYHDSGPSLGRLSQTKSLPTRSAGETLAGWVRPWMTPAEGRDRSYRQQRVSAPPSQTQERPCLRPKEPRWRWTLQVKGLSWRPRREIELKFVLEKSADGDATLVMPFANGKATASSILLKLHKGHRLRVATPNNCLAADKHRLYWGFSRLKSSASSS